MADIITNLVGWWKLNEGSGSVANDSSGNGNNGNLVGSPTWVTGKLDTYAIQLNGVNQWVDIPDSSSLDVTGNAVSFGGWFYATGTGNYQLGVGKSDNSGNLQYAIFLQQDFTNQLYLGLGNNGDNESGLVVDISTSWDTDTWNHLFVTYDSGIGVTIYLNGEIVANGTTIDGHSFTGAISSVSSSDVYLGAEGSTSSYELAGDLQDCRVYARCLTQDDITALVAYTYSPVVNNIKLNNSGHILIETSNSDIITN